MTGKKIKMPSSFTVLMMITVVMAVMTWIVPPGTYKTHQISTSAGTKETVIKGTYQSVKTQISSAQQAYNQAKIAVDKDSHSEEKKAQLEAASKQLKVVKALKKPQGIWDILMAPFLGTQAVVDIIVVVLFVGGLFAVENEVGAIKTGFKVLVKKMQGREKWLIPLLITIFAICGSSYGSQEETVVYYIFLVPLMVAAGYNALTTVMMVIVGTTVGIAASTVNPFSAMIAAELAGGKVGDGMLLRAIMLVLGIVVASVYVMRYAEKIKAGEYKEDSVNDSSLEYNKPDNSDAVLDTKKKATLIIFALVVLFTVLAYIPWDTFTVGGKPITIFVDAFNWLYNIPFIGKVIGEITPFGWWWFNELGVLYFTAAIIIGLVIYRMNETIFVNLMLKGAADVLPVCLIIGIARGITVVMNDGNITHTILYTGEQMLTNLPDGIVKSLFGGVLYLVYLPLAFLVPSTSGLASMSMPIFGELANLVGVERGIAVAAFVSASGLMQMFAPTVGALMAALVITKTSYSVYIKRTWKLFILLAIMYITVITVASVSGFSL
ncbi:MAG: hypothetical protein CR975_06815 [Gammaproteobacteria bacterium]|nr:MAG: hypothetical protein CR975_06815 [Gammaproteobacteria bacterium]